MIILELAERAAGFIRCIEPVPDSAVSGNRSAGVQLGSPVIEGAELLRQCEIGGGQGLFGVDGDQAARPRTPIEGRGRPLDDIDALNVGQVAKTIAVQIGGHANAVHIILVGWESPDIEAHG